VNTFVFGRPFATDEIITYGGVICYLILWESKEKDA
jgi:hypothetical protein